MLRIDNELYKIKIYDREDGYNICSYNIVTDEEYQLKESSGRKIIQRLVYSFSLYIEKLSANQFIKIITDLKSIAKELRISEEYVDELIRKYWDMKVLPDIRNQKC